MTATNNKDWDFDEWLNALDMSESRRLTEEEWAHYVHLPIAEAFIERDYLIGYFDMGIYEEITVRACSDILAMDGFLCSYQPKRELPPYIARCETKTDTKARLAAGYTGLPEDRQMERYADFGNAYYEALNN